MHGKRLRELRKKKGKTQAKLPKMLTVNTTNIGKWELYNTTPPPEMLNKICSILDTDPNYLLGVDNSDKNNVISLYQGSKRVDFAFDDQNYEILSALIQKLTIKE